MLSNARAFRVCRRAPSSSHNASGSLDRLALPTLVVHGADDRLVPTRASAILEGRDAVTRRVYPDTRHELHNEPEGPAVLDDVVAWIRANVHSARSA